MTDQEARAFARRLHNVSATGRRYSAEDKAMFEALSAEEREVFLTEKYILADAQDDERDLS